MPWTLIQSIYILHILTSLALVWIWKWESLSKTLGNIGCHCTTYIMTWLPFSSVVFLVTNTVCEVWLRFHRVETPAEGAVAFQKEQWTLGHTCACWLNLHMYCLVGLWNWVHKKGLNYVDKCKNRNETLCSGIYQYFQDRQIQKWM